MFNVAICDDETEIQKQVGAFFSQLSTKKSTNFNIYYFHSGEELIHYYEEEGASPFHILILDIEMGGLSGVETAQKIRSLPDRDVQIIFLTSHTKYMMDSFDVQTFQYLIKPVEYELFEIKIMRLCKYILSSVNRYFMIRTEHSTIILKTSEIIALVKIKHSLMQNKLNVITANEQYIITGTLANYAEILEYSFLHINRSVIVNLEHVRKFTAASVMMSNKEEFTIGRSHAKSIKDAYARYMIGQFRE